MQGNLQNAEFIGDKTGSYNDWLKKTLSNLSSQTVPLIKKELDVVISALFDKKTIDLAKSLKPEQRDYIWSSYKQGKDMADGWRKVAMYLDNEQNTYHRYTQQYKQDSDTGIGFSMFAKNRDEVQWTYGTHHYTANATEISKNGQLIAADNPDFIAGIKKALKTSKGKDVIAGYIDDSKTNSEIINDIISGLNPEKIVNSADTWDSPEIVSFLWDSYLEPNGITAVETSDGLLVFDKKYIRYSGEDLKPKSKSKTK